MPPDVSVIIAVYNEEAAIGGLLDSLPATESAELIAVDGGSTDRSAELAAQRARVVRSPLGRGVQMNAGAKIATGRVLLFLHADVRLAPGALDRIRLAMQDGAVVGGNFDIRYEGDDLPARVFTRVNRWRRRWGILYGDSGIFCRRAVFESLGGFEPWPIMEDYEFGRRLAKAGKLALLDAPIRVSARRWRKGGLLRTLWSWFLIQSLYSLGLPPARLARIYRHIR